MNLALVVLLKTRPNITWLNAVSIRVTQNLPKRFQSSNFDVKDEPHCRLPITDKDDAILEKVEQDRHISSYNVAEKLGIELKTIFNDLKKAAYTKHLDTYFSDEFIEKNVMNRVHICDSLLKRNQS
ncbi:hypothetical protein EVAR_101864_1 [Eumeta japonica]|uniref:Histone-lysine N-methyltransferase SETMAR n=1 Tax=Eumeta variegata TaxID=151549 RepID=A0A4C1SQR6_EUMVA|nr:hypothetical protein EVAR_101864_1 [Eumeta japonica]